MRKEVSCRTSFMRIMNESSGLDPPRLVTTRPSWYPGWTSTTRQSEESDSALRIRVDEIDACDISSLRIASIIIEVRERAGDHGASCPVSTSIGRPKRVLCPYIVLMKYDSNLPVPRDVPAACSEKGMVYLDSVLEQLGHFSLRIMT